MSAPLFAPGPAGQIEYAVDLPAGAAPVGVVLMCHPHPQHGGTMGNKVVTTIARALTQSRQLAVVRFNTRGTGHSEGQWDEGRGEIEDAMAMAEQCGALAAAAAGLPAALPMVGVGGFSFGGYVASHVAARRRTALQPLATTLLIAPAAVNFPMADPADDAIVIMGDADEIVDPAAVAKWAQNFAIPVDWIVGAGHFFHGRLIDLKNQVLLHWPASVGSSST